MNNNPSHSYTEGAEVPKKEQLTIFFDEKWMGYVKPEEQHNIHLPVEIERRNALPILNDELLRQINLMYSDPIRSEYTWPGTFKAQSKSYFHTDESEGYILSLPEAQKPEAQKEFTAGEVLVAAEKVYSELVEENAKLTALLKEVLPLIESTRLPNSCINNWDEVKFCPHRQGEGNKCEWCFDREYLVNRIEKLLK